IVTALRQGDPEWSLVRVVDVLSRVGETVAYAHEHGVVHRDLKPANVMVGRFGETYVLDWGLARAADRPDRRDIRIRPENGDGAQPSALLTMDGDVLGTPAYMAPEQARGEVEAVGRWSDVYSLGAMLYHVLAGSPPYLESGDRSPARAVLQRVLDGPPAPLAIAAPDAPPELAAICTRAMAPAAADRYGSATEFAAELRAFLENRVVRAYATGPVAELRKWMLRNRGVAIAGAAAVLMLVIGLSASLIQKSAADHNAGRAVANFELAFQAAEDLLAGVGITDLANEPGADPMRHELAGKALTFYRRFLELHGDDPRVMERVARSHYRIAMLESTRGRGPTAIDAWGTARTAYTDLVARLGPNDNYARVLAMIDAELALFRLERGETDAALESLAAVAERVTGLRSRDPDSVELMVIAAKVQDNLGHALLKAGRTEEAARLALDKLKLAERIVAVAGHEPWAHERLASARLQQGAVAERLERPADAEQAYRAAIDGLEAAHERHAQHRGIRARLAESNNSLAVLLWRLRRGDEAGPRFESTIAMMRELVIANPGVRNYHGTLGGALCNLGILRAQGGDPSAALPLLQEAVARVREALRIDPAHVGYLGYRKIAGRELANACLALDRPADAASAVREMVRELPDSGTHHWLAGQLLAACATGTRADEKLPADQRDARVAEYGDEAMHLLQAAARRRQADPTAFGHPAFEALRDRPDFLALRAELGR
ncbi:MAG: protein kinase, partial [Planctomycetes bacterium]|nr:protein kinase [Planctomycetota bacterium]